MLSDDNALRLFLMLAQSLRTHQPKCVFQFSTGRRLVTSLTLLCTNCFHSVSMPLIQQSATLTLLCTNCFHSVSMPLIQQSATSESLQHVIFLMGISHFRAPSMAVNSLVSMTAAKSSNLGIVWLLSGVSLVLDATNFI